eukprot:6837825-Alexandrium_andersonii.AAC.1
MHTWVNALAMASRSENVSQERLRAVCSVVCACSRGWSPGVACTLVCVCACVAFGVRRPGVPAHVTPRPA